MSDRPVPTDPPQPRSSDPGTAPVDATSVRWHGWRILDGRKIERDLELEDPETGELFLDLLERAARLTGVPAETRLRSGEVRIRGERSEGDRVRSLSLSLRLELDREPLGDL